MFSLEGKRVWVTGHNGLVGSAVVRRLASEHCLVLTASRSDVDLRDQSAVNAWMERHRPDAMILAAARVGGILANNNYPADFLYDNLMIEANLMQAAHRLGVGKLLFLGSSCIYPKLAPQPLREDSLLTGPLEPTNEWYAIAKIAGVKLCQAYRRQHGCDFISAMPTNLYGIGDNFDLQSSHVLPALMRRIHTAKTNNDRMVSIWGSGKPLREFLVVDDLADACVFLMRHYSEAEPINVGSGDEVSIRELATLIADVVGYYGEFQFDSSKPDGTPRKRLDLGHLTELGWKARTPFKTGLAQVYDWYQKTHDA
jgi:GDP-L-fucose synthase